jgi:hypothetical protein
MTNNTIYWPSENVMLYELQRKDTAVTFYEEIPESLNKNSNKSVNRIQVLDLTNKNRITHKIRNFNL